MTRVHVLIAWKVFWVVDTLSAALDVDLTRRPEWKIFALGHSKMSVCLLSMRVHVFLRSVKASSKSTSGFHLLRITLWMSLCGYIVPFFVIIEQMYEFLRERCGEVYNHKLCIHQLVSVLWASLWARWLRQRGIHGALFARRIFGSCLSHFL